MIDRRFITTPLFDSRPRPGIAEPRPPTSNRLLYLISVLGGFAWQVLLAYARRRVDPGALGRDLRSRFERLGGVWVKLGQILSIRVDLFPQAFCQAFAALQDRATGFPGEMARSEVERALGRPVGEVFQSFELEPFAAASIGQLHRARLRGSGVEVAVKVRRPYVADLVRRDLALIRRVSRVLARFSRFSQARLADFYAELERTLEEEIDYRFEAAALRRMRKMFSKYPHTTAPRIYRDLCTATVLVTEFVPGALMADLVRMLQQDPPRARAWMAENNIDPDRLARRLLVTVLRSTFEDNQFHGDLHPGNIILLRQSRMVLIDFGTVGFFDEDIRARYFAANEAIVQGQYSKAADLLLLLRPSLPAIDFEPWREEAVRIMRDFDLRSRTRGLPFEQKSAAQMVVEVVQSMRRYGIPANWQSLRFVRMRLTIEVSLRSLAPDMDAIAVTRKAVRGIRERQARASMDEPIDLRLALLSNRARRLGEATVEGKYLELEWLRRRARTMAPKLGRVELLGLALTNMLLFGMVCAVSGLLLAIRYPPTEAQVGGLAGDLLRALSNLPGWANWSAVAVLTLFFVEAVRQRRRFSEPGPTLSQRLG